MGLQFQYAFKKKKNTEKTQENNLTYINAITKLYEVFT